MQELRAGLNSAEQRVCNGKECGHLKAFKRENNLYNQCQRAWLINCWPAKLVFPKDSGRAQLSDTKNGSVWTAAQCKDNWLARTLICIECDCPATLASSN